MIFAATVQHAREIMESLPPEISGLAVGDVGTKECDRVFADFKAKKINEANDVLSDPIKRRNYDATLGRSTAGAPRGPAASPPPPPPPPPYSEASSSSIPMGKGKGKQKKSNDDTVTMEGIESTKGATEVNNVIDLMDPPALIPSPGSTNSNNGNEGEDDITPVFINNPDERQEVPPPPPPPPPADPPFVEAYPFGLYATSKSYLQRHRVNPGRAKYGIFTGVRDNMVQSGIYRPCNRFRDKGSVLNKALRIAEKAPMLARYNFLRS